MLEYLGLYDDEGQVEIVKIHANDREEADNKFIEYLKKRVYKGEVVDDFMYVIPLFAVTEII